MMEIITVSEKARIKIQELLEEQKVDKETHFLRVGVKGGGCSGLSYELGFDNISQVGDNVIEDNSTKIVIDKKSFIYLFGTELLESGAAMPQVAGFLVTLMSVGFVYLALESKLFSRKSALLRNAKIRLSDIHPGRLLMNLRGQSKWIK